MNSLRKPHRARSRLSAGRPIDSLRLPLRQSRNILRERRRNGRPTKEPGAARRHFGARCANLELGPAQIAS